MKAPRCQYCGVEEWGHLCGGRAPSEIERRAARGAVTKTPATKNRGATEISATKILDGVKALKRGRGRPKRVGEEALSSTERSRRRRAALRALRAAEGK